MAGLGGEQPQARPAVKQGAVDAAAVRRIVMHYAVTQLAQGRSVNQATDDRTVPDLSKGGNVRRRPVAVISHQHHLGNSVAFGIELPGRPVLVRNLPGCEEVLQVPEHQQYCQYLAHNGRNMVISLGPQSPETSKKRHKIFFMAPGRRGWSAAKSASADRPARVFGAQRQIRKGLQAAGGLGAA